MWGGAILLFGNMRIRRSTREDVPALVDLNTIVQSLHADALPALFRKDCPRAVVMDAFERMLDDPKALWLIAEDKEPCGYIYAEFRDREESWFRPAHRICNISHIAVRRDHRKAGVARALIEAVRKEADVRGYRRIELDVWSFNGKARKAFEHLGFRVFNERMAWQDPHEAPESSRP